VGVVLVVVGVLVVAGVPLGVAVAVGVTVGVKAPSSRKTIEGCPHQAILLNAWVEAVGVAVVPPPKPEQALKSMVMENKLTASKRPARLVVAESMPAARLSSQSITRDNERDLLMKKTPVWLV